MTAETQACSMLSQTLWRKLLAIVLLFVFSGLVIFFSLLHYYWPNIGWNSKALTLSWKGEAMSLTMNPVTTPTAHSFKDQGQLTIGSLTETGTALVSLPTPVFQAEDYPVVQWSILNSNAKPGAKVEFWWYMANDNSVFSRQLEWTGNAIAPLRMAEYPHWRGQIKGLALMVDTPLDAPLIIEGVKLESLLPFEIAWRKWFIERNWQSHSINRVGRNSPQQWLVPLPFIATVLGLTVLGYRLLVWRKFLAPDSRILWVLLFLAWFALDLRWQCELWQKLAATQQRFAGKSGLEKHLSAEDAGLFGLMQQFRAKLPSNPLRIFIFDDEFFMRTRAAYYLYPLNVMSNLDLLTVKPTIFKSGDFIIIIQIKNNKAWFDQGQQLLKWGAGRQLSAELLLLIDNYALIKVR